MLEVNSKKTKVMTFQKRARKFTDNFHIGKDVIDLVHESGFRCTFLSSSNSMTFHGFFHDFFKISMTLGSVVTFENFKTFPGFSIFFVLKQFNRNKL